MKILGFIVIGVISVLVISQVYLTWSMSKIERHKYEILLSDGRFELRKYEPAVFASVQQEGKMFDVQNQSFRELAGYIFGGNESATKIAMTAPVQMMEQDDKAQMTFMIPEQYDLSALPKPNSKLIQLKKEPTFYAAVVKYSGFNSSRKFERYRKRLSKFLADRNLPVLSPYIYQGYNPPFQLLGRSNEVMVKISPPIDM